MLVGQCTLRYVFISLKALRNIFLPQGVSPKDAINSSVKKVLLLAVVPEIAESHFNVRSILQEVDLKDLQYIYSVDVKMGNKIPHLVSFSKIFS